MKVSIIKRDLNEACRTALEHFGIADSDSLLALVFGSRARGYELATSDFDIIFLVQPRASYPHFAYRTLEFSEGKIDTNIIDPTSLDRVCRKEIGWAYRLYRARPIPSFSRIPPHLAEIWLQNNDALIRHPG